MSKHLIIYLVLFLSSFTSYSQRSHHFLESHLTKEIILKYKIDSAFIISEFEEFHLNYDTTGKLNTRHILTYEKDIVHYLEYKNGEIHQVSILDETNLFAVPLEKEKYIYKGDTLIEFQIVKNNSIISKEKYIYEDQNLIEFQVFKNESMIKKTKYFYDDNNKLLKTIHEECTPIHSKKQKEINWISTYNENGLVDTLKTNNNLTIDYYLHEYEDEKLIIKKGINKEYNLEHYTEYDYNEDGLLLKISEYEINSKGKIKESKRMNFFYFDNGLLESVLYSERTKKKIIPYREILMDYEFLK